MSRGSGGGAGRALREHRWSEKVGREEETELLWRPKWSLEIRVDTRQ